MICERCAREIVPSSQQQELSDVVLDHVKQGWSVEIDETGIVAVACPEHSTSPPGVSLAQASQLESVFSVITARSGTEHEQFTCWCGESHSVPTFALSAFFVHARACEKPPNWLALGTWIRGDTRVPVLYTKRGLRVCARA